MYSENLTLVRKPICCDVTVYVLAAGNTKEIVVDTSLWGNISRVKVHYIKDQI